MAGEIATAFVSILPSFRGGGSTLSRELSGQGAAAGDAAGASSASHFSNSFSSKVASFSGTIVKGLGLAFGGLAIAGATVGLKTAAGMEQARISFTTMLGSADKADVFLKQLAAFAASTPFEFPELQTAASSLVSAGFAAADVIPIMTTLGDVTSGMGTGAEGVQRATVALQQMSAAGKITGEDLNQLRDAGVPVFDLLAAATGKSKEEVAQLAAAGKLGKTEMNQLFDALKSGNGLERFSGLMEAQSHSLTGVVSTLKDTIGQGLAKAFQPLIPIIENLVPKFATFAGILLGGLGKGLAGLIGFFTHAGDAGHGLISKWSGLMPTLVHLKNSFMITFTLLRKFLADNQATFAAWGDKIKGLFAVIAPLVLQFINSIAAHLPEIMAVVQKAFLVLGNALSMVVGWITTTIVWFTKHKAAAIALGVGIALLVAPVLTLVAALVLAWKKSETFRKVVGAVLAAVSGWISDNQKTFQKWLDAVVGIWNRLVVLWQAVWVRIRQFWDQFGAQILATISSVWSHIAAIIGIAWDNIKTIISTALAIIKGVIDVAIALVQGHWGDAWDAILGILSAVWDGMTHLVENAFKVIGQLFGLGMDGLKLLWSIAWDLMKTAVSNALDGIVSFVAGLPDRAISALSSLGSKLWDFAKSAFAQLLSGLINAWNGVTTWLLGLPGKVVGYLAELPGKLWTAGSNIVAHLLSGMESKWPDLASWWLGKVEWIIGHMPFSPAKHGPLRTHPPERGGANIVKYMARGMQSQEGFLRSTVLSVMGNLSPLSGAAFDVGVPRGLSGVRLSGTAERSASATPGRTGPQEVVIANWPLMSSHESRAESDATLRRLVGAF